MRQIETTTVIDASPDDVWAVLMDTARYSEWNPFIKRMNGQIALGQRLDIEVCPPGGKGMRFRPRVTVLEEGRELRWLGSVGVPGIFDGSHAFRVEPSGRGTLFAHSETFTGLLVPFMSETLRRTRSGFELMNRALRARVEEGASAA